MFNLFKLHLETIKILFFTLLVAQTGLAVEPASNIPGSIAALHQEKIVHQRFAPLFTQVTKELEINQQRYLSDPTVYYEFVDRVLKPLWDTRSTSSALVGRQQFEQLSRKEQTALVNAVDNTLRRYAFEGLERYSGQLFRVVDVVVNERASMGWVQVLMESPLIPDLHIDVLIKQLSMADWKAVDVRFKGITYVAVKKHGFRETMAEQGVKALIAELQEKNREYFAELCSKARIVGKPPCALQVN